MCRAPGTSRWYRPLSEYVVRSCGASVESQALHMALHLAEMPMVNCDADGHSALSCARRVTTLSPLTALVVKYSCLVIRIGPLAWLEQDKDVLLAWCAERTNTLVPPKESACHIKHITQHHGVYGGSIRPPHITSSYKIKIRP